MIEGENVNINKEEIQKIRSSLNGALLVAATKYVGTDELNQLYQAGIHHFGENKVQDFLKKYDAFTLPVHWHFIGTLQPNKVKYIIDKVELIHSVDSIKLIEEIEKQAVKADKEMPVLLQVNISQEETKHGFDKNEIVEILNIIKASYPHVIPHGLMTMAPHIEPEQTRPIFHEMKTLLDTLALTFPNFPLTELSMGMSNDYTIALEEGSTIIRVGSRLFKK